MTQKKERMKKLKKSDAVVSKKIKHTRKADINLKFNFLAKKVSDIVGHGITFIIAVLIVLLWAVSGQFFEYSEVWQLVINTGTTIITFLVVFLIQNTQNRDMEILQLKLDELIKSKRDASNKLIDLNDLSDKELRELEKEYNKLKDKKTGS